MGPPLELSQTIEYSRVLIAALPEAAVLVVGADETVWLAEGKLLERRSYPASHMVGRKLADIIPAVSAGLLRARFRAALGGTVQSFDYRTADGVAMCWIHVSPMHFGSEHPVAVMAVVQDVTEREELNQRLQAELHRRRNAEEMAGVGHWEIELATGALKLSEGAMRLVGLDHDLDLTVTTMLERIVDSDRPRVLEALRAATHEGRGECECEVVRTDGQPCHLLLRGTRLTDDRRGEVLLGTAVDLTARASAERALAESESLLRDGFDGSPIGMAFSDPHTLRYLRVNQALCKILGRSEEELLQLGYRDVTLPEDLVTDAAVREAIMTGRSSLLQGEKRYVRGDGSAVWALVSVTAVRSPGGEVRGLLTQVVDVTERKARERELAQNAADLERLREVREAISAGRLVLYAQPIFDLGTGQVVQRELLVRMQDESGELIPPAEFLPVAERYGMIGEIDCWVTRRAIELAAGGQPVEVNLSAASVGDPSLLAAIRETLAQTGADPSLIVFEVTETALMADVRGGSEFARAVRELGCKFALDDFGTGYGTFTYLRHIPVDYLKIDVEFVRELDHNVADQQLVHAIVTMAQDLGKKTIAEGVESAGALDHLLAMGVDHAQGYHLGRPAPL